MDNKQEDRISKYLSAINHDMMFAELSSDYLERIGAAEILMGIPVPIRQADEDSDGSSVDAREIVFDMARIIGGDPMFVYADKYLDFIKHAAGEQAEPMLVAEGARSAEPPISPGSRTFSFLFSTQPLTFLVASASFE